ncbi:MAG: phosphatase [Lachnospiraceae bacterium]|jgi:putative hydrolase|nr:phosphatase [Lachnospiraceae bacterium]
MNDILDLHTHTIASGHAYNTLYEMAHAASQKGLQLLGVTDHAPRIPGACHPFYFLNFKVIPRELYGVRILMGCELNIVDYEGGLDLEPRYQKGLDLGIASIHEPCYTCGTISQNTSAYLGAMKNPIVQIIGHPDDGRFPVDYETLVCAAKEHHVLLEINNSSLHPACNRKDSRTNGISILEYCKQYQVPVILDSDAHCEVDVGNHSRAHSLLEEMEFPSELVVNDSIEKVAAFIPALAKLLSPGGSDND